MTRPPSLPSGTHIGRVSLLATDRPELVEFYRDVVGLEVLQQDSGTTTLGAGETPLLVLNEDETAPPRHRTDTGLYHTAFRVPSRTDLADALERIRERWHLDGASDHDVSEALYLTDPAGNGVEIYRDRPRDRWPTSDGTIQMGTHPLDLGALVADATGAETVDPETTVGHVHLEVSSVDAARAFYGEAMGFDVTVDPAPSVLFLAAGGYHHHIGVNTWNDRSAPASGCGVAWFEVVVPDESTVAAIRDHVSADSTITERGAGFEVADPDGIGIRVQLETNAENRAY